MVITKTPFRVSFFGGGTDYPAWANENGGVVLSTTINKYCYVTCRYLPPFFDYNYKIRYTENEYVKTLAEIKHPSVRACISFANVAERIEMQHNSDLPAMSGLGSSSSFTVGFLNALYALQGRKTIPKSQLASDAIYVEQELLKENVGSQDQVAAAFGGFNKIEFGGEEKVRVAPLAIPAATTRALENHLMLFFTGFSRNASEIAAEQIRNTGSKERELRAMGAMVPEAVKILAAGPARLNDFGRLLHESWQIKRGLSSQITNSHVDGMYAAAREAGALGGKLLGAGGGGFMLVLAKPEDQPRIKEKLGKFLYVPFRFDNTGSQVIFKLDNETYLS
ncbi:MAG: kinase [Candidatus Liptonbacteria bacterium RIFCSPLOWO2_01_FULL_52_25]|uniref:Kinase n=1 Tax=Candidatus Liptonbacteria bacterium RIFCSPLOWO2_01_FULL_52_25 TaxID=1798650 RepID=A0A1G2CEQ9_9BACT|nr:MAG: kinase [Candidatus Liptonbacteria bacterium RIFCSPLOWO2_01_FULL_52_25]